MGKRKPSVVAKEDGEGSSHRRGSRSSSSSIRERRPRGSGRGRSKKHDDSGGSGNGEMAKFATLSEDFYECHGDIQPGLRYKDTKELWVDKHKPCNLEELAVHKKKVEEVKKWLEERMLTSDEGRRSNALLISGQAGVGKSAAIHLIASQLGAELYEWTTPTPTLWQEHVHNTNSGVRYMSKLDEFEAFIEKIRKYRLLSPTSIGGSRKQIIILIDDLPMTNGKVAFVRLCKCLTGLVRSTHIPTIVLITECHVTESVNISKHYLEELASSLEKAGIHKVVFNPITISSIRKTLSRICQKEKYDVTVDCIDHIARASVGDIRHAVTSLQYLSLTPENSLSFPESPSTSIHHKESANRPCLLPSLSLAGGYGQNSETSLALPYGRDETLSLFHALGKFLHNKRESIDGFALRQNSLLQEKFRRNPVIMDSPEKILFQAHGQARRITDFLHENVLDFISDDAIDDVWLVTSYLCDADSLLACATPTTWSCTNSEMYGFESIVQSAAASVAARGVLYGNSHPSPTRWHSIRTPRLWQIEQSAVQNKKCIRVERLEACNSFSWCSTSQLSYEYRAATKWLRSNTRGSHDSSHENRLQYYKREEYDSSRMDSDNSGGNSDLEEIAEDEIEDW